MTGLTIEEQDLVLEGLEALKSKDLAGEMMVSLLEATLFDPDKMPEDYKKKQEADKVKKETEKKAMERKINVLKAKLTLMFTQVELGK